MPALDAAAYKNDVVTPVTRKFDRALREALTEMKDPATRRPSALDLTFVYQINPAMSDGDIAARIKEVLVLWNNEFQKTRNPKVKAAADYVRQLHELLVTRNPDFGTQKWWSDSVAEKQQAQVATITKLADLLRYTPFAGLNCVTLERLAGIAANDAAFSMFGDDELRAASKQAGLTVVLPVDLPDAPGIGPYAALVTDLEAATDATIVHTLHFSNPPASFKFLDAGEGGTPFRLMAAGGLKLDEATAIKALADNNKSASREATARTRSLSKLKDAAAAGADLNRLAVFHLADLAAKKCQGGVLQIAYQDLVDTGLDPTDAARIVLSVGLGAETTSTVTAETVRTHLSDGALGPAGDALSQLESKAADEQAKAETSTLRAALNAQHARVEQLRSVAAAAIRANDIAAARTAMLECCRLDRDNETLVRDLASLPPEPPINVTASSMVSSSGKSQVRVAWQAGFGSDGGTRYRVLRKVGSAPANVSDGSVIGELTGTSLLDDDPVLIDVTYYAAFATRGNAYSLPTSTSVTLVPTVTGLVLSTNPTRVTGHWSTPPGSTEVTVEQIAPDGSRKPIPLSGGASFTSDGLVQGLRYQFAVTAHYRSRTGAAVASPPVFKDAVPRAEARAVPSLTVKPVVTPDGGCRVEAQWPRQHSHEVQLWCFAQQPTWAYGSSVEMNALLDRGKQLQGQGADKSSTSTLVAEVPSGLLFYVAITVDGAVGIVGQVGELGICEPVGSPRVTRFGDEAVLSWDWPSADYSVRAVWSGPSTSGDATISKTRYDGDGGMRIRVGHGRSEIRLASFIDHAEGSWTSPVRTVAVEAASATIKYDISWQKRGFGGASGFSVVVRADGDVPEGELVIGYRADRIMPSSIRQLEEIRREKLNLASGEPATIAVALPKMPKYYWVRCFLADTNGARLIDPPTNDLRGR